MARRLPSRRIRSVSALACAQPRWSRRSFLPAPCSVQTQQRCRRNTPQNKSCQKKKNTMPWRSNNNTAPPEPEPAEPAVPAEPSPPELVAEAVAKLLAEQEKRLAEQEAEEAAAKEAEAQAQAEAAAKAEAKAAKKAARELNPVAEGTVEDVDDDDDDDGLEII